MKRQTHILLLAVALVGAACADEDSGGAGEETEPVESHEPMIPITHEGELVSYAVAEGEEICPHTVDAANDLTRAMARELGSPDDGDWQAIYYVLSDTAMEEDTFCPMSYYGPRACADSDRKAHHVDIYAPDAGVLHELVHVAQAMSLPGAMPVLQEGMAMMLDPHEFDAFGDNEEFLYTTEAELDAALESGAIELDYFLAWYLAHTIHERGGLDALIDIWMLAPKNSTAADLRAAYTEVLGTDLADDLVLDGERVEMCSVAICPEPTLDFVGELTWAAAASCDDARAIGLNRKYALSYEVFDLPAGSYRIEAPNVGADGSTLARCGAHCGQVRISSYFEAMDEVVELEAGRYVLGSSSHNNVDLAPQTVTITRLE